MKFDELKLSSKILEAVSFMGFEETTQIQERSIPLILEGKDLIAVAQTGTGKTAAFALPILDKIFQNGRNAIQALIIVPTRELAIQIERQIQGFAYFLDISSIAVYGGGSGNDFTSEKQAIQAGVQVIVATPGKLISHIKMGYVDFSSLSFLVLDEADRMLDMGFYDDITSIVSNIPKLRQTLLFSATMPDMISNLGAKMMNKPERISIAVSKPAEGVLQGIYLVYERQKISLINSLIQNKPDYSSIIIFCATKRNVTEIVRSLKSSNSKVSGMSSDLEQKDREELMRLFKAKKIRIVVATDVISRGIDIDDINLIINYSVPPDPEDYVHRVGRTARAEKSGVAITLVNPEDMKNLEKIQKLIGYNIQTMQVPQELGEQPTWSIAGQQSKKKRKPRRRLKTKSKNNDVKTDKI